MFLPPPVLLLYQLYGSDIYCYITNCIEMWHLNTTLISQASLGQEFWQSSSKKFFASVYIDYIYSLDQSELCWYWNIHDGLSSSWVIHGISPCDSLAQKRSRSFQYCFRLNLKVPRTSIPLHLFGQRKLQLKKELRLLRANSQTTILLTLRQWLYFRNSKEIIVTY